MNLKYLFQSFLFFENNYSRTETNVDYISGYIGVYFTKIFFDNNVCEYKFQNLRQVCIYAFFIFVYIPKMYANVQLI